MNKKNQKQITIEDHVRIAEKLVKIYQLYSEALIDLNQFYKKTEPFMRLILKNIHHKSEYNKILSLLDDEYCKIATDEEINKYGLVYYPNAEI